MLSNTDIDNMTDDEVMDAYTLMTFIENPTQSKDSIKFGVDLTRNLKGIDTIRKILKLKFNIVMECRYAT
jgi:hypothetical protein